MAWELHESPDLEPLAEVWKAAWNAAPASIFQTFAFARHWARAGCDPRFCILTRAQPPLVAPFVRRGEGLTLLGEGMFDYLDLIGTPDAEAAAGLAAGLADLPDWDQLEFAGWPAASPFAAVWQALGASAGRFAEAPQLSPGSAAAWARRHPRAHGRLRRALAQGLVVREETEAAVRAPTLEWLLAGKRRALAARGAVSVIDDAAEDWLRRMVRCEPALAELWSLRRGETLLAALLTWRGLGVRYGYTICYEPGEASLSPGILLLSAVIERSLEEGRGFDFLTGEQAFKQRFGDGVRSLTRLRLRRAALLENGLRHGRCLATPRMG